MCIRLLVPTILIEVLRTFGPGIESRWGRGEIFRAVQTDPEAQPAFCAMGTGFFSGVTRQERDADHPPSYSAVVVNVLRLSQCLPRHVME